MNPITLSGGHGILMINIFSVPPENQQALVDAIKADGQESDIPGLLSRYLLQSDDGVHVTHCMHWASEDAFNQATATNAVIGDIRQRVGELGARPASYQLIDLH